MHWKLMFPKRCMSPLDLKGRDADLTIRKVERETLSNKGVEEEKWVMFFEETAAKATSAKDEKRLVMNVVNSETISALHGPDIKTDWPGKRITLYPTQCSVGRETMDCIRVRSKAPEEKK